MDSNFNNRDFEHFVKQNADQYRMFPSERVWEGINNTLHTRRRWYGIGVGLLLLTTGVVTWVMLSPAGKGQPLADNQKQTSKKIAAAVPIKEKQFILAPANPSKNRPPFIIVGQEPEIIPDNLYTDYTNNDKINAADVSLNEKSTAIESLVIPSDIHDIKTPVATAYAQEKSSEKTRLLAAKNKPSGINQADGGILITDKKEVAAPATENNKPKKDIYPLTIESVVNSYKNIAKNKKTSFQIYFTPTVSYRSLKENKEFLNSAQSVNNPAFASLPNVNNLVTHKPDIGFELGFSTGYAITKNMKLIGGLQFNVSKYDIRAYKSTNEVATIALNTGTANSSVSTVTSYRNYNGYYSDWLHNLYLSASLPIGIELNLAKIKSGSIGISSSIQPTYIISDRAYLLSTDYKNYAQVPSLIRKFNVSTNFEAFVTNTSGKIKWKLGPQVRYQLQSSFQDTYPFKEHLFDFGLKFGVILK